MYVACGGGTTAWLYEELIRCARTEAAQGLAAMQKAGVRSGFSHCARPLIILPYTGRCIEAISRTD